MNRSLHHPVILVTLVLLLGPAVQAQTEWTHHLGSPVLEAELFEEWDQNGVWTPCVILAEGDTLKMWYAGGNELGPNGALPTHTEIGYAWSLDGVTWTRHDANPVLTPGGDAPFVLEPTVLIDGDTLRMWYAEGNIFAPDGRTRYATSTDGVTWERYPNPVLTHGPPGAWNETAVGPGSVIKEDNLFKMWFHGGTGPVVQPTSATAYSIGYATSPDGITWTLYDDPATTEPPFHLSDPVLMHGPAGAFDYRDASRASVHRTADGYEMWYHGHRPPQGTIGYATSPDGIAWTKYEGNPVLTIAGAPWASSLFHPSVLFYGDQYHMWYTGIGVSPPPFAQIGYATAPVNPVANEPSATPPEAVALRAPYPNPTAAGTALTYRLAQPRHVALTVYDLLGREVVRLVDAPRSAGEHTAAWDGRDGSGRRLSAGVYVVRLQAGEAVQSRKVLLLR